MKIIITAIVFILISSVCYGQEFIYPHEANNQEDVYIRIKIPDIRYQSKEHYTVIIRTVCFGDYLLAVLIDSGGNTKLLAVEDLEGLPIKCKG